ncbi:DUF2927 domain-containing protein [Segnochrobactraceae bacterium EtOH-i3]
MRRLVLALTLIASIAGGAQAAAPKAPPTIPEIVNAFSDEELIHGFLATVFGSEALSSPDESPNDRVLKFRRPVRVYINDQGSDPRRAEVEDFVRILDRHVHGLDIRMVKKPEQANMTIYLLDRGAYKRTVAEQIGNPHEVKFLVENDCSAVTSGRVDKGLTKATIFLVVNEGRPNFRHCMIEEIAQSLGPVNDDSSLTNSIFNDNSTLVGFGVYDWFILNMLYDPRIKVGMTPEQAEKVLPAVIASARKRLPKVLIERRAVPADDGKPATRK